MHRQLLQSSVFFLCFTIICGCFWVSSSLLSRETVADTDPMPPLPTVVLDAGHGGEDGGASSVSGLLEKDLNLAVAKELESLLLANGYCVLMTRTDDRMLYDRETDYRGRKKLLDQTERIRIAESAPNAIFISIHMNSFPQEQYSGLQVWYSENDPRSEKLAADVQAAVRDELQPQNDREIKRAGSSIFLLHRLQMPAILIECGFLSNRQEASLLGESDYQRELAYVLFLSINRSLQKINAEIPQNA